MTIWMALLLGLVQGLCEFLPVSSSGHLVLLHKLFGVTEGVLFFTIMLHVGTLIAVFAVYYRMIWAMLRHPFQKKVGMLLAALLPTVVIAVLFSDFFEDAYAGRYLGFGFLLTSLVLTLSERKRAGKKKMETMRVPDALCVGLLQGLAILPGLSRSGSTISGALFCGLTRKEAADFSFLLSIPAILGSVVFELPDVIRGGMSGVNWLHVFAGMAAAAVSGYFAIRWMLRLITGKRLFPFAIYTGILGVLVLADQFEFHIFF